MALCKSDFTIKFPINICGKFNHAQIFISYFNKITQMYFISCFKKVKRRDDLDLYSILV